MKKTKYILLAITMLSGATIGFSGCVPFVDGAFDDTYYYSPSVAPPTAFNNVPWYTPAPPAFYPGYNPWNVPPQPVPPRPSIGGSNRPQAPSNSNRPAQPSTSGQRPGAVTIAPSGGSGISGATGSSQNGNRGGATGRH